MPDLNAKRTLEHYETMARAALYPELVKALRETNNMLHATMLVVTDKPARDIGMSQVNENRALLSRLPAERDKGAG